MLFLTASSIACQNCDCDCANNEKCNCKKECLKDCDCKCHKGEECLNSDCKCACHKKCKCKDCKCGCQEGEKCTCKKHKKSFKLFKRNKIKCNCEDAE